MASIETIPYKCIRRGRTEERRKRPTRRLQSSGTGTVGENARDERGRHVHGPVFRHLPSLRNPFQEGRCPLVGSGQPGRRYVRHRIRHGKRPARCLAEEPVRREDRVLRRRLLAAAERHRRPRLDRAGGAFLRGLHRPACSRPLLGRSGRHLLRSRAGRRIRPVCGQPFPPPCRRRAPRGRTGRTGRGQGRREQGVVGARQARPLPRERDRHRHHEKSAQDVGKAHRAGPQGKQGLLCGQLGVLAAFGDGRACSA